MPTRPDSSPLEVPWVKYELMRHLATGEHSVTRLSEMYAVTHSAISHFRDRHKLRIEQIRQNLGDEFAELWIAGKRKRIGVYQQEAERLVKLLTDEIDKGEAADRKTIGMLTRELRATQRNVAEELGDLKTTVAFDSSTLRIEIAASQDELDKL